MSDRNLRRLARRGALEAQPVVHRNTITLRARIAVLTPTYSGKVDHECALSMQLATMHCLVNGVALDWIFAAGFSLINHGRNWLNAEFLSRPEYSHCLWLDDDLGFDPKAIMKLYNRDLDAVGGCYVAKHPTVPYFPYKACGPVVGGLQPVSKLPGGFLMLSRRAVETVAATCPEYEIDHADVKRTSPYVFDVILRDKTLHGEDFVYCERLTAAGVKVYVETDINFMHIGRKAWNANLAAVLAAEAGAGAKGEGSPERWAEHAEAPKALT